jgi:hypothetical protein
MSKCASVPVELMTVVACVGTCCSRHPQFKTDMDRGSYSERRQERNAYDREQPFMFVAHANLKDQAA